SRDSSSRQRASSILRNPTHSREPVTWVLKVVNIEIYNTLSESDRLFNTKLTIGVIAEPIPWKRFSQSAVTPKLVIRVKNPAFKFMDSKPVLSFKLTRMLNQLLRSANLTNTISIGITEEKIPGELHLISKRATQKSMHRQSRVLTQ